MDNDYRNFLVRRNDEIIGYAQTQEEADQLVESLRSSLDTPLSIDDEVEILPIRQTQI
jgi:hypothetical protein